MKTKLPKPVSISFKSSQYQPKQVEKEVETEMPEMSDDQLRDTYFRPFKINEED